MSRLTAESGNQDIAEQQAVSSDSALVGLVNRIILDAVEQKASDIHIEANLGPKTTRVRFRKDGALMNYLELPAQFRNAVVSRIKIMSRLDITERRKPQDGKIDFHRFGPAAVELRVATVPTTGGLEDVVMRVLAAAKPVPMDELGLEAGVLNSIKRLISKPHGLFLVCGPTGSGKTTTLHSLLAFLNTAERKIWTAEDPIEITQPGLRQVQVNSKIGWTFAAAMRSFMRADPDVIMVGEMRDAETAKIGIEASLTGHLVLSTLHTNSAAESIVRLLDLGMDPFNFADALLGVLAERLARRLCPHCKIRVCADCGGARRTGAAILQRDRGRYGQAAEGMEREPRRCRRKNHPVPRERLRALRSDRVSGQDRDLRTAGGRRRDQTADADQGSGRGSEARGPRRGHADAEAGRHRKSPPGRYRPAADKRSLQLKRGLRQLGVPAPIERTQARPDSQLCAGVRSERA